MSQEILKDVFFSVDAVDLSDHVISITLDHGADEVDGSVMGDNTHKRLPGSLKDWSLSVEFAQDFAVSSVDDTLFSKVATLCALVIRKSTGVKSTTNPELTGDGILLSYPPISGAVGDRHAVNAGFSAASDLARATS